MNKNQKQIKTLTNKALELKSKAMIPSYLAFRIIQLNESSELELVSMLKDLTLHYMRVPKYYKKFPNIEEQYNKEIKQFLKERSF